MGQGWKRVHLLVFLIFLKHAVGHEGWTSQNVQPQNWSVHKLFSPREVQSSVLEAPVTGSIPVEEVASNMFAGKNPNASRPPFSISRQYVKGGFSSSYGSMSPTQSAPTVLDSISSLLQLQGSSSPNAQNVFNQSTRGQDSYSQSSQYGSGLQRVSAELSSTPVRGGSSSGLSILSKLGLPSLDVSDPPTGDQSSSNMSTSALGSSGLQLGGTSSLFSAKNSSSTGSSSSSRRFFTSTYQGSSGSQLAGGSSQLVSASGLFTQSPSTESQDTPGSSYAKLAASPLDFSQSTTDQSSYSQYTPSSESSFGTQLAASRPVPGQGSRYGSSVEPQDTTSQHAPTFSLGAKLPVSSQYYQATWSDSPSREPSASRTQAFQAVSQGSGTSQSSSWSPSRFSSLSSAGGSISSTDGSSVRSQHASSQNALASLDSKVPLYSQAAPSSSSLSLSSPSQWQPSSRWLQRLQASGTVASEHSSPSQGSKAPSRLSTSAISPGQFASKQKGSSRFSGLSMQSQSTSSQYSPGSSAYAKLAASPQGVSQLTSGQSSYSQYTSSSQSRAGTHLAGSSHHAPVQSSTFTDGSFLQLQGTSSQYAPVSLGSKVPVYGQAAPSAYSALSQTTRWEPPTSRWSQGFQTSGAVASQIDSHPQGSKAPIGQSTYSKYTSSSQSRSGTQLAGSSPYVPVQSVSTSTDGSSLQLHGTSSQYAPGLDSIVPVYGQAAPSASSALSQTSWWEPSTSKWSQGFQTSGVVTSQSSSPSQGSKAPSKFSTLTSGASPTQFASKQEGSGRYSGLSSLSQGTSTLYSPGSPAYIKRGSSLLDVSRHSASGQSTYSKYTSSSQSRAGTQLAGSSSYVPVQSVSTSTDGSSLQLLGTSRQYAPSPLNAKVPVYSQAAPSGPSLSPSQPSQWQTSSRWSQAFQTSGTGASRSSSRSKAPSRFSTLTSAAGPGHFASKQDGSGKYSGFSSLSQGTSSQYSPGPSAYAKHGSSLDASSQSTSDPNSSGLYASSSQSMAGSPLAGSSPILVRTGSTSTGGSSFQFQGTSNQYVPSVPSVAQGSQSSISSPLRISSFFGVGQRLSSASGSQIHSQISPGLSASVQHPSDSMTSSLGSSVQGALQGIFSGQSSSTYGQKPSGYSKSSQSSSATGRYFSSVKG
ncbi:hornerin-like isoform X1 [Sinocyclocheilus grahami]|uniref:hornerin-like isoform X1 n=1 Tax=Sinocyclocheilus grahami TaxID=75366 RepID=UPI0007AC5A3E|nr:PREDICTED: hornerin-like isoform X1 [Sinocyclocheilus grahami]